MSGWKRADAEYNLRQLRLAKSALDDYLASDRRVSDLGNLVGILEGLNAALESPDDQWQDRLDDHILTFESAYAVHLDRGASALETEAVRRVEQAISTLHSTIDSAIQDLERLSDGESPR